MNNLRPGDRVMFKSVPDIMRDGCICFSDAMTYLCHSTAIVSAVYGEEIKLCAMEYSSTNNWYYDYKMVKKINKPINRKLDLCESAKEYLRSLDKSLKWLYRSSSGSLFIADKKPIYDCTHLRSLKPHPRELYHVNCRDVEGWFDALSSLMPAYNFRRYL